MSVPRAAVVAEARTWIGTPFHHQASLKGIGCDCIGLVVGVARALGLPEADRFANDPRFRGYARTPVPWSLLAACKEYLDEIDAEARQPGDVAQFTFASEPMHFGIISARAPDYVIHGYQRVGCVVENAARARFWRCLRVYRLRGVD